MKKLISISNQIKNQTYSYTGKGSFESAVSNNKDLIFSWLEELIPLQRQIEMLNDLTNLDYQKRNYTRILTKIFPEAYHEFVSVNILVRDSSIIANYYANEFNLTLLYENLINDRYLKYPGKYEKFVEYNLFQKFVMMYKDDLSKSLDIEYQTKNNLLDIQSQDIVEKQDDCKEDNIVVQEEEEEEFILISDEEHEGKVNKPEKTNWTQLLLGKGK